jgi:hypothetical protein
MPRRCRVAYSIGIDHLTNALLNPPSCCHSSVVCIWYGGVRDDALAHGERMLKFFYLGLSVARWLLAWPCRPPRKPCHLRRRIRRTSSVPAKSCHRARPHRATSRRAGVGECHRRRSASVQGRTEPARPRHAPAPRPHYAVGVVGLPQHPRRGSAADTGFEPSVATLSMVSIAAARD